MPTIFVVSDGTGQTAERMVRSALIQFQEAQITLVRRDRILEPEQVRAVVAEAASQGAGAQGRTEAWPLEEARKALGSFADALALDQQVSGDKAKRLLGWEPDTSFDELVRIMLDADLAEAGVSTTGQG